MLHLPMARLASTEQCCLPVNACLCSFTWLPLKVWVESNIGAQLSKRLFSNKDNDSLQCVCRQIRCKHVLVTVPITVLQREDITFVPPLPQLKQQAIQRVKMSNAIKVTLQQTALVCSVLLE